MKQRTAITAALVLVAATVTPVTAAHARSTDSAATTATSADRDTGGEYVVAYDTANADQAMQAISAAGGTIEGVQAPVGLALVSAGAGFAAAVSTDASVHGAMLDMSIGGTRQGMAQVRATKRLTVTDDGQGQTIGVADATAAARHGDDGHGGDGHGDDDHRATTPDPLEALQWDMRLIGATADGAQRRATGRGVTVGIIDTGVDGNHPDIADHFDNQLSRNFTHDRPDIDGPCDTPTCIDPANVDEGGHGTHVAGTVGAARNGIGITGVAPDATIVNVRAGQDSGYFFFYETVAALLYAGDARLDVVNMSFYTDPWLYNCTSRSDYVSGDVTDAQIAEQAMVRTGIIAALEYAHSRGVTLVAAAGNDHTNLALPQRSDGTSPDYPADAATPRVVTNNCLDLPAEGPHVISVSAVGPTGTKSDFSNYGLGQIEVAAPGGWYRDQFGTPNYRTNANLVLSSYPYKLAIEEGKLNPDGSPVDANAFSACDAKGRCGAWVYLQGTSMASPHVAGEAALVIQAHGHRSRGGYSLNPDRVGQIIGATATDHACPAGGVQTYANEGRSPAYDAVCEGTTAYNGLYGEGIINATAAVGRHRGEED